MYGSLSLSENNQQQFNKLWKLYQVNNSQENATGSTSLQHAETRILLEQIFKKTDIYTIKSETSRQWETN